MNELLIICIFLVLNSFAIIGFNRATEFEYLDDEHTQLGVVEGSKMIFWKFRYWCVKTFGYFWSKPLCICPPCMSSVHSTYFFAFFLFLSHDFTWIWFYPMYVLILSGLTYTLNLKLS